MCATCGCEGTVESSDEDAKSVQPVEKDQDDPAIAPKLSIVGNP
ncbi:MAG: hypothetical protein ACRENX_06725 [Candidatus Dormibacteria bacterium]